MKIPSHCAQNIQKKFDKGRENLRVDIKVVKEGMPVVSTLLASATMIRREEFTSGSDSDYSK
jgi:hypothetical protein